MQNYGLTQVLRTVAGLYPAGLADGQVQDIPRIAFNIGIAFNAARPKPPGELEVCDLGGGVGLFSVGCAAYGVKRVVLIDDFDDPVNRRAGEAALDVHRRLGVEVVARDVVEEGLGGIAGAFDVITTFDSVEHWHHSPKRVFRDVVERLKPGGVFVMGVPNCVNLRKRLTVPLGIGKWSGMQEWYEADKFRGHVREPDVDDLRYIARDLGLTAVSVLGRNWAGYHSASPVIRAATKLMDYPLRLRPQLCSDIYLVGRRA
jgi:SAM-dependent methyltransferase